MLINVKENVRIFIRAEALKRLKNYPKISVRILADSICEICSL